MGLHSAVAVTMRLILAVLLFSTLSSTGAPGQSDEETQAAVQKAVRAYSLNEIQSSVQGGTVILTGSVQLCRDRLLAIETVKRIHGVKVIEDRIDVAGPPVSDAQLKVQIDRIIADRIRKLGGFGFGSMKATVGSGVVTLSGTAAPELSQPAINAIAGIQGLKNVIDHVLRVPPFDVSARQWAPGPNLNNVRQP